MEPVQAITLGVTDIVLAVCSVDRVSVSELMLVSSSRWGVLWGVAL